MRAMTASLMSPRRPHRRRRRRELQALDALGGDRLDDGGDHGRRRSPARCRGRRRPPSPASPRRARRSPGCRRAPAATARRRSATAALRPGRHAQRRHDRSGGGQAHPLERDAAEPQHAGTDARRARGHRRRRRASPGRPWPGSPGRRRGSTAGQLRRGGGAPSPAAGRRSPPGARTGRRRTRGPRPGPPPTPRPARPTQDAWSSTSPGSTSSGCRRSAGGRRDGGGSVGRSRATVPRRLSSVSARSATTCSRSSPASVRAESRSRSTSIISRSSMRSDACSSAWKRATSSSALRPSAIDQIAASSSGESTITIRRRRRVHPGTQARVPLDLPLPPVMEPIRSSGTRSPVSLRGDHPERSRSAGFS